VVVQPARKRPPAAGTARRRREITVVMVGNRGKDAATAGKVTAEAGKG
jgi:hypothetical protein